MYRCNSTNFFYKTHSIPSCQHFIVTFVTYLKTYLGFVMPLGSEYANLKHVFKEKNYRSYESKCKLLTSIFASDSCQLLSLTFAIKYLG